MHLDHICKVLQHCYGLQTESGPGSAFHFALISGPRRTQLSANYANSSNTQGAKTQQSRSKRKGKQREIPLQGLLQIDRSEDPPTTERIATVATAVPSNNRIGTTSDTPTSVESQQNQLVRIDMRQILKLRELGYEVLGPVNGLNKGYPEYEVPKMWLDVLISKGQSGQTQNPIENG